MAGKKKAVARKATSTEVANIKDQIQKEAAQSRDVTDRIIGNNIKVKGKSFVFPSGVREESINVIIVDHAARNLYFEDMYVEGEITPPSCFALAEPASLGGKIELMKPSPNSKTQITPEGCKTCPMNAFGSDNRGRGKACQNRRLLVVVDPTNVEGDLMSLSVSPTGSGRFDAYVQVLADKMKASPIAVVTQIGFDKGTDYPSMTFTAVSDNDALLAKAFERRSEAQAVLKTEPLIQAVNAEGEPKKARGRKRA